MAGCCPTGRRSKGCFTNITPTFVSRGIEMRTRTVFTDDEKWLLVKILRHHLDRQERASFEDETERGRIRSAITGCRL